jgi:hypothetical protein
MWGRRSSAPCALARRVGFGELSGGRDSMTLYVWFVLVESGPVVCSCLQGRVPSSGDHVEGCVCEVSADNVAAGVVEGGHILHELDWSGACIHDFASNVQPAALRVALISLDQEILAGQQPLAALGLGLVVGGTLPLVCTSLNGDLSPGGMTSSSV